VAFHTLVSTDDLARHLDDRSWCIVDCRYNLSDPEWGTVAYASGHVPGAAYANLDQDLSAKKTGTNGRHPLPDAAAAARVFARLGIGPGVQVAAYDQDNGMFASRLWWMLRWLGHDAAAVVEGGFAKWLAEDRPTRSGIEQHEARPFEARANDAMTIDAEGVAQILHNPRWRLIDARAPERYRGEVEPIDKVAGRIPGAVNHPYTSNLAGDNTFKSAGHLRAAFDADAGETPVDHLVCYCGSGVTACHNLLALEHAGFHGAKLYPGSWSEWSADPTKPIEKG
jgi:thiosulfate/3-mercaptopyruvate sulfurtransferase